MVFCQAPAMCFLCLQKITRYIASFISWLLKFFTKREQRTQEHTYYPGSLPANISISETEISEHEEDENDEGDDNEYWIVPKNDHAEKDVELGQFTPKCKVPPFDGGKQ
uniref:Uncharacterized protein n=1 Tax=Pyxicephalus adspersus TaxID=30357 RepID=A0AAV3AMY4_PYXAD|nr:TPA: hypothetical protein GDO54_010151 [Pyxicephalus adspersus]